MQGGCKCGAVSYTADEALRLVNCHCCLCRSINGGAFSSYVVVKAEGFTASFGDSLGSVAVGESAIKHFCRDCGTPVFNTNPERYPGYTMLYFGTVEGHEALEPSLNIYCSSELDWVETLGSLPSFDEGYKREGQRS